MEEPVPSEAFAREVIQPSVPEEEETEPVREEPSRVGEDNNPNRETPLRHHAPANSIKKDPDPLTGSKTITTDSKKFSSATIVISSPADDTQRDDPATSESGDLVFDQVMEYIETQAAVAFGVRWCGYYAEDYTWEPPDHITRSTILRYYGRHAVTPTSMRSPKHKPSSAHVNIETPMEARKKHQKWIRTPERVLFATQPQWVLLMLKKWMRKTKSGNPKTSYYIKIADL